MIEIKNLRKSFGSIEAISGISLAIRDGQVFGLVGTNGAGKSTLLRIIAGILRPDVGQALIDEQPVYDNPAVKRQLFFISDEPYFFANSTPADMADYLGVVYEGFDRERFNSLLKDFDLDPGRRVSTFSKGMKKQLAVIGGVCAGTKYLLCDETFDGLDPVMRQGVKTIFAGDMAERGLTPIIASHNLRELEDICEHVGLLHKGGLLLSEDLADMKLGIQKLQCVFSDERDSRKALAGLTVLSQDIRGRLHTLVVRGEREEILDRFRGIETVFFELLPLTLEEIFISETEVAGYDIQKLILG